MRNSFDTQELALLGKVVEERDFKKLLAVITGQGEVAHGR